MAGTRVGAVVLAVASVLLLASCAPAPIAAPPPPTTAQITSLMSAWPAYEAALINSNSPATLESVSFVRFVPDAAWYQTMSRCTAQLGVTDITYHPDHTSSAPATSTTKQWARDLANGTCLIQYPPDSVRARLKTPKQLDYIYSYYENELLPCMRTQGVGVTGVPSRSRFHLTARNGLTLWNPYRSIAAGTDQVKSFVGYDGLAQIPVNPGSTSPRMAALLSQCPALPPGV